MYRFLKARELDTFKKQLLARQRYRCALCFISLRGVPPRDVCLDHNHGNGQVRNVLCRNCNAMEGKVFNCARRAKRGGTPYEWLGRVLAYWERHENTPSRVFHPSHRTPLEKKALRAKRAKRRRNMRLRE